MKALRSAGCREVLLGRSAEVEEAGGKVHTGDEEAVVTGVLDHTLAGSNGSLRIHVVGSAYLRVIDLQGQAMDYKMQCGREYGRQHL